ncbi:hypothetical protein Zm00014a_022428 [Zea mays]|uniref:Uncharacterized protein n=1 Tax=Zea mays TaxID=4577 RepID=A0A3L6DFC4_MAIZE|nr:hypothetical protein Zm00014a_022428 [Zea mays]
MTSFMAACLVSIKKTKRLGRRFQLKRRKVKSGRHGMELKSFIMMLYGGATAVGVYNNRALLTVATTTFQTFCSVISKFF